MNALMAFINRLHSLDSKTFKKYALVFLGVVVVLSLFMTWRYYNAIYFFKKKIAILNDLREEARTIRATMVQVQTQRLRVNQMLQEEIDFKIGGYFNTVLEKLRLTDFKKTEETSQLDRQDNYREAELIATMTNMNMKQLTELLYELEQKKRIYIKKLDIEKSKKNQEQLEITLIIATLLNKEVE